MKKNKNRYPKWLKKIHTQRKIQQVEDALDGKIPRSKIWYRATAKEIGVEKNTIFRKFYGNVW